MTSPQAEGRTTVGHTPGPHKVDGRNTQTKVGGFNLVWGGGGLLAYVANIGDARLYAAAPDLLEALERLARDADQWSGRVEPPLPSLAHAWDVIAKARGQ